MLRSRYLTLDWLLRWFCMGLGPSCSAGWDSYRSFTVWPHYLFQFGHLLWFEIVIGQVFRVLSHEPYTTTNQQYHDCIHITPLIKMFKPKQPPLASAEHLCHSILCPETVCVWPRTPKTNILDAKSAKNINESTIIQPDYT